MSHRSSTQLKGDPLTGVIANFMSGFTVETTPGAAKKTHDFREYLLEGTWVYVTSLPDTDFEGTIATCKRLANEGMQPVPHFTARSIANRKVLEERLSKVVSEAGVKRVLAIAGADSRATGEFENTMAMLETGLFDKYGIQSIGVAGHPEGSPDIKPDQLMEHGGRKNDYSQVTDAHLYLITQFVFEAQPVIDWVERIDSYGNKMPVVVGLPGLATLKSLLRHAQACGVGASMTMLKKQTRNIAKLLTLQEPDKLVRDLAEYKSKNPGSAIDGAHVYPLGGLARSSEWSYAVAKGDIKQKPEGFNVNIDIK